MKFYKLFNFLTLLALIIIFSIARPVNAASDNIFTSPDSIIVKVQEGVEYFFAFKTENKVTVLEKHAEKRLVKAQVFAEEGNNERVQNMIQNYQQIKEKQNNLLGKINDEKVLSEVAEQVVEQQKTMEAIKTKIDEGTKQKIIQVQEQVVNQVAKQVVEVNGPEGATGLLNEVAHVWAPGTGPGGGEAGVVYAGGGKLIYAPGTGPGGQGGVVIEGGEMKFATGASMDSPGADVKTVEVKTGGGSDSSGTTVESNTVQSGGQNMAPGTTSGGETGIAP